MATTYNVTTVGERPKDIFVAHITLTTDVGRFKLGGVGPEDEETRSGVTRLRMDRSRIPALDFSVRPEKRATNKKLRNFSATHKKTFNKYRI